MAVGITIWITAQAVINVGAVIGVLPVTGIPLPFVSYGGSSLRHHHGGRGDPAEHRPARARCPGRRPAGGDPAA